MMKKFLIAAYSVFLVCSCTFLASCASSHQSTDVVTASGQRTDGVSQKRDPSRIFGDENNNRAFKEWSEAGYPEHPASGKYKLSGKASWYGPGLNGNKTASGEIFDMYGMTAAHPKLPFGTIVIVTNEKNHKSVVVRINDRGPFVSGRIIDMSYGSAYLIDMIRDGVVPVRVEIIRLGK